MQDILKSHTIMSDYTDHGHGSQPGSVYSHCRCVVSHNRDKSNYRCYVHCTRGSDQGCYADGEEYKTCGRGTCLSNAIENCKENLIENGEYSYAAQQAIMTAIDEVEEFLEESPQSVKQAPYKSVAF